MFENGYIDRRRVSERQAPRRWKPSRRAISSPTAPRVPPRDYFTDEIRRQLAGRSAHRSARRISSPAACRARLDGPGPADVAERALRGRWKAMTATRGAGAVPSTRSTPPSWATKRPGAPRWPGRDPARHRGWQAAVVLEVGGSADRDRGSSATEDGHFIPAEDVPARGRKRRWATARDSRAIWSERRRRRPCPARHDRDSDGTLHALDAAPDPRGAGRRSWRWT
jgi:penicillin-binding protein 1A